MKLYIKLVRKRYKKYILIIYMENLTVSQLKQKLRKSGVRGYSTLRKNELVNINKIITTKVVDLKQIARQENIKGRSKMNKSALVKNIGTIKIKELKNQRAKKIIEELKEKERLPTVFKGLIEGENITIDRVLDTTIDQNLRDFVKDIKIDFISKTKFLFTGRYNFTLYWDETVVKGRKFIIKKRKKDFPFREVDNISKGGIIKLVIERVIEYFKEINSAVVDDYFTGIRAEVRTTRRRRQKGLGKMKAKSIQFVKLPLNIESNNDKINHYSCVTHYLQKTYGNAKGFIRSVKKIENKLNWTIDELTEWLEESKVSYICYYRTLKVYKEIKFKNRAKTAFRFIAANEHIYPVSKKEVSAMKKFVNKKHPIDKIVYISPKKISKFVKEETTKNPILNFRLGYCDKRKRRVLERVQIGNTLYLTDNELVKSYEIYSKVLGYLPIKFNYHIYDGFMYLAHKEKLFSTFDDKIKTPSSVFYNNTNIKKNLIALDKNKAFSHALYKMNYIPVISSSTFVHEFFKNDKVEDYHLYFVSKTLRNCKNFIMPGNWYPGFLIKKFTESVKILYYRIPDLIKNPFQDTIKKALKLDSDISKRMINLFIGVCQIKASSEYTIYKDFSTNKIESTELSKGYPVYIDGGFFCTQERVEPTNKYKENMLPLALYVVNYAKRTILDKLMELKKLDDIKIRMIKTDCITFSHTGKIKNEDLDLGDDFSKWHIENVDYRNQDRLGETCHRKEDVKLPVIKSKIDNVNWEALIYRNTLFDCYAGSGKTYMCINKIMPLIEKRNYIIIAAQHKPLTEYYEKGYNAKVIQYFTFNYHKKYEFRNYDYIIVDEVGLMDNHHMDYIYMNMNKHARLIMMGDKHQLKPYGYTNAPLLYNAEVVGLFDTVYYLTDNYRNHYTKQNYVEMQNLKFKMTSYEKELINKLGKLNITVLRKTRDEINDILTSEWVDMFSDLKVMEGGKLVSQFSDRETGYKLNEMGIYNCMFLDIVKYDNQNIYLKDRVGKEYIVSSKIFKGNFNYGYAITSFRAQGMSIPYEDLGIWDYDIIKRDGRQFYTIFSRILDRDNARTKTTKKVVEDTPIDERMTLYL